MLFREEHRASSGTFAPGLVQAESALCQNDRTVGHVTGEAERDERLFAGEAIVIVGSFLHVHGFVFIAVGACVS